MPKTSFPGLGVSQDDGMAVACRRGPQPHGEASRLLPGGKLSLDDQKTAIAEVRRLADFSVNRNHIVRPGGIRICSGPKHWGKNVRIGLERHDEYRPGRQAAGDFRGRNRRRGNVGLVLFRWRYLVLRRRRLF